MNRPEAQALVRDRAPFGIVGHADREYEHPYLLRFRAHIGSIELARKRLAPGAYGGGV